MIFLGDTVFPGEYTDSVIQIDSREFLEERKIVNLESLILSEGPLPKKKTNGIGLYSSKDIIKFLKNLNVEGVCLANNHIIDFKISIERMKQELQEYQIASCGAGENAKQANVPLHFEENGKEYIVLNFGWEVIGCKAATSTEMGVNAMRYQQVITQVKNARKQFPESSLITVFHWNYEFELYPQPAHRQLAFELIDLGVDFVFGHHSHIVQGYEIYKNKPIFYGLGNFYLPEQNYCGFDLKYSKAANEGLGVKLADKPEGIKLFWTFKDEKNQLKIQRKELLIDSEKMAALSQFSGLTHEEYIKWFALNRKKNKLLPIYKHASSHFENALKDKLNAVRQSVIDFSVKVGLKG